MFPTYSTNHTTFHMNADENVAGTLSATDVKDPPMVCCGFDAYNQASTGSVSKSLTNRATDSDHTPVVAVESYGFDQGTARDVGEMFLKEQAKTITNGTCPGHHNGVLALLNDQGGV